MNVRIGTIIKFWILVSAIVLLLSLPFLPTAMVPMRIVISILYVFFIPGFILLNVVSRDPSPRTTALYSPLLSIFTLYPSSILVVTLEKILNRPVFSRHLEISILANVLLAGLWLLALCKRRQSIIVPKISFDPRILLSLAIVTSVFSFLVFVNLGRANVFLDEYDISYQAYNLIDGIADGRRSFLLSFNTHPPLVMNIKHYVFQIVNPEGLDTMTDWQYRFPEALAGLLTIFFVYLLGKEFFGQRVGLIAAALIGVNNYHIWFSRFVEREIFLSLYMVGFVYALKKIVIDRLNGPFVILAGVCLGGALLVKASAFILVATLVLFGLWAHKKGRRAFFQSLKILILSFLIFSPVIIFNLAMYFLTGYADSLFVRVLPGARNPFATASFPNPWMVNPPTIFFLLVDLFSLPFSAALVMGVVYFLKKQVKERNSRVGLILIWLMCSIIFYFPNMVRAYYLHFVTLPAVLVVSLLVFRIKVVPVSLLLFIMIFPYSLFYSYNTNLNTSYQLPKTFDDAGRSGTPLLLPSFQRHFSIAARSWSGDWGWQDLVKYFQNKTNFCLIFSPELDSIALRRYFWYGDKVKMHYLGSYGPTRYPICNGENEPQNRYLITEMSLPNQKLVTKIGPNPFLVYKL